MYAGPAPEFSSSGGSKTRRRGQKPEGGRHIFKIQYWIYAATGGPNVKWGAPISNGRAGHHWTALYVRQK